MRARAIGVLACILAVSSAWAQIGYSRPRLSAPRTWTEISVLAYGDSKTVQGTWEAIMEPAAQAVEPNFDFQIATPEPQIPGVLAKAGVTVAVMRARIDADLLAMSRDIPVRIVLFNLGVNEMAALPAEATWIGNVQYILDKMFDKWPGVQVYLMRPWMRGKLAESNTVAGWIDTVVASRTFAHLGPDERIWMEGGDDGATMTNDGIHPNNAGDIECAAQWRAVLGY